MRGRLSVPGFALLLLAQMTLLLLAPANLLTTTATAHDASTFSVIIRADDHAPDRAEIVVGDSVFFRNVDDREGITHRIVHDADGDGLYNGTDDWDSGNLTSECELDAEGNKTDEGCEVTYLIEFNATELAGTYAYQDLLSDGTVIEGTVIVAGDEHQDEHSENGDGHVHGVDDEGHDDDDPTGETQSETQTGGNQPLTTADWLLYIAGAALIAALLLLLGGAPTVEDEATDLSEEE